MCKEIIEYQQLHHNDFSNYFNLKDIDKDAEEILNKFLDNPDYSLNKEEIATPILSIAQIMGFKLYTAKFKKRNLSGTIGISKDLKNKYGSEKVIILNNEDTDEHILFTLAHELAHYIFDYKKDDIGYSNTYYTNEIQNDSEARANRFAAAFLMPATKFIKEYSKNGDIRSLSKLFKVPETSVQIRLQELDLHEK